MVFSSLPPYHHDPANWQQQPNHSSTNSQLLQPHAPPPPQPPLPPPPPPQPHGGGGAGSIRPGSMADRARLANIPMPETAMKCPRCESTNTKFCYFNNYSLTQPRHFCKTCRRYWTRGGALRSVPVGGGCRRNKRSKATAAKNSPASSDRHASGGGGTSSGSSGAIPSNSGTAAEILGLTPQLPALRFMAPLHHHPLLAEFASPGGEIGLGYGGLGYGGNISAQIGGADLNFHIGSASAPLFSGGADQWRFQSPPQFPFLPASGLAGDASASGLFEAEAAASFALRPKATSSGITHQMAAVKMEDSANQAAEMSLSKQFLGSGNDHYWSGGGSSSASAWADISGFSSSSTTSNQL